jgi:hypothetical protein
VKTNDQIQPKIDALLSIARDATRTMADRKIAHAQAYALTWVLEPKGAHGNDPLVWGPICAAEAHRAYVPEVKTVGELVQDEVRAGRM